MDPATGLLEGDEDEEGFEEEYPLEQLNIATADFMAKVCMYAKSRCNSRCMYDIFNRLDYIVSP